MSTPDHDALIDRAAVMRQAVNDGLLGEYECIERLVCKKCDRSSDHEMWFVTYPNVWGEADVAMRCRDCGTLTIELDMEIEDSRPMPPELVEAMRELSESIRRELRGNQQ